MSDLPVQRERRQRRASLTGGVILIVLGVAFLLDKLGVSDFGHLMRTYWPMFVIIPGVLRLFEGRRVWGAIWMIAVGLWLQAVTLHLAGLTFDNAWPLLLIVAGGGMVLRSIADVTARREERHD